MSRKQDWANRYPWWVWILVGIGLISVLDGSACEMFNPSPAPTKEKS